MTSVARDSTFQQKIIAEFLHRVIVFFTLFFILFIHRVELSVSKIYVIDIV